MHKFNIYEIVTLAPFAIWWILLIFTPRFALKLTGKKRYLNPTPGQIWFARIALAIFLVVFTLGFYFTDEAIYDQ